MKNRCVLVLSYDGGQIFMEYDITVVIPTYNVERYIESALDSVVKQNFKGNMEIIIIDDCSTDETPSIVKKYIEKHRDFNIRVLYQEKNMRQGTARNRGIREGKGKYIFFLDGDDFLDPDTFQKMYDRAEEKSCDFVLCDWAYYYQDKGLVYVNNDTFLMKDYLFGEECEDLYQAVTYFTVNKLYNKDFLIKNRIKYGEGYIYEDFEFYVKVAQYAEIIGVVQNPYYRVRVNEYSTTKTDTKNIVHIESFLNAVESSLESFEPRKDYSYYHLFKHLISKTLYYSAKRAPFGYKRRTLKRVLEILNSKKNDYKVPTNVVPLYHFYFRRKFVQSGKVNLILIVDWLQRKGKLAPLFRYVKKIVNLYKKLKQKKREKIINNYFNKPISNNTILFLGFDYRYVGNSKYFFDFLKEQKSSLNLFFVTTNENVPEKYRIEPRSLKFFEVLAQSQIVIGESWLPLGFRKRPEATWIQLWHGTPFKKLLFDSHEYYISKLNRNHKRNKQKDIRRWDFVLADSDMGKEKLSSSFAIGDERILNYGYPRVQWVKDHKKNMSLKAEIRNKLNIPCDKKVILYVPTWRDYNFKEAQHDFSYLLDLKKLSENLQNEYVILNKQHSMEGKSQEQYELVLRPNEDIEVQELILISDFVISDYSSIIFDCLAIDIPFYLYINDFNRYEKARGVYPDMHEVLKTLYVSDEDDLISKIKSGISGYPEKQYQIAKSMFGNLHECDSNERLYNKIQEIMKRNNLPY